MYVTSRKTEGYIYTLTHEHMKIIPEIIIPEIHTETYHLHTYTYIKLHLNTNI